MAIHKKVTLEDQRVTVKASGGAKSYSYSDIRSVRVGEAYDPIGLGFVGLFGIGLFLAIAENDFDVSDTINSITSSGSNSAIGLIVVLLVVGVFLFKKDSTVVLSTAVGGITLVRTNEKQTAIDTAMEIDRRLPKLAAS